VQDEHVNHLEGNIDMKLKSAFVTAALLASFGAHATTERTQPDGRVLKGWRLNTQQLNGIHLNNGISANGLNLNNAHHLNGFRLKNGLSVNGLMLRNGLSQNGMRLNNGIGINGLMMKNAEHLGDASTGVVLSGGPTLMPQVVGIVFDGTGPGK
jgi:hypothetical protein